MAVNETIVTGRKFRKLTDAASKKWQRISFWHKASDCEFNDGKTAEEKLGAIKGITTDLNVTVPGYAADATRVSELNNSLTDLGGFKPVIDESTGEITGYKTTIGGADTVFPFSSEINNAKEYVGKSSTYATFITGSITVPSGIAKGLLIVAPTVVNAGFNGSSVSFNKNGSSSLLYNGTKDAYSNNTRVYKINCSGGETITCTVNHGSTGGGYSTLRLIFLYEN